MSDFLDIQKVIKILWLNWSKIKIKIYMINSELQMDGMVFICHEDLIL